MDEELWSKICYYDLSSLTENSAEKFSRILIKEKSQEFHNKEERISFVFGEDRDSKTSLGLLRRFIESTQTKGNVVYISKNHNSNEIQKKIDEIEVKDVFGLNIETLTTPIILTGYEDAPLTSENIMDIVKQLEKENLVIDTLIIDSIEDVNTAVEIASKFTGKVHFIADFDFKKE